MSTILSITTSVLYLTYPALLTAFRTILWPVSIATVVFISGTTYGILAGILRPDSKKHSNDQSDKTSKGDSDLSSIVVLGMAMTSLYFFQRAKLEMFARQPEEDPAHITVVLGCLLAMLVGHAALVLVVWTIVKISLAAEGIWRYCTAISPPPTWPQHQAIATTTKSPTISFSSGTGIPKEDNSDDTLNDWYSARPDYEQKKVERLRRLRREFREVFRDDSDALSTWSEAHPNNHRIDELRKLRREVLERIEGDVRTFDARHVKAVGGRVLGTCRAEPELLRSSGRGYRV
ncbi:hypothetical protein LTR10_001484 [Elasticomyces elasticus]|nr:hypothetical protein LTR10_001484 [Elasticomyces elasticus]KAK4974986.1 hypothetical protein LTR42_004195 [Elasticomyces elasticus]